MARSWPSSWLHPKQALELEIFLHAVTERLRLNVVLKYWHSHHPCFQGLLDARPDQQLGIEVFYNCTPWEYPTTLSCRNSSLSTHWGGSTIRWSPLRQTARRRTSLVEPIASIHDSSLRVCLKSRVTSALPSNWSSRYRSMRKSNSLSSATEKPAGIPLPVHG
jgi:hypothetical protein